ncbi:probable mitochondrial pyruvate carrier 2 isoform X2 [Procambarus clarkii]|uniref:probable mitochondrial pyruvate carrier 2 isoform X2 n=1 Tax=Procambarus clarkii TaxID=6728 RepID=UPI001E67516F|nr:probable mitochondrial pyruvate carrier 2 isoform X2 [Procambarus clarkii]
MSRLYRAVIRTADKFVPEKFQPFWNHPAGPKTVFFWGPCVKWCLVIAGLGDAARPADKLSLSQSTALGATGLIWSRMPPQRISRTSTNLIVPDDG